MKKRIMIVLVLLILLGGIFYYIYSFNIDKKQVQENIIKINFNYEEFYKVSMDIDSIRNDYSIIIQNSYYETLNENNDKIVELLDKYREDIYKIEEMKEELNTLCKVYYSDDNINQKCNSYKITYESIYSYFNMDINGYNELVDKYNENKKDNKLEKYIYVTKNNG